MDDGIGCFFTIFALIIILLFAVATRMQGDKTSDRECKEFYGNEYVYIFGNRSPSLCVSKEDGTVKYYDLIGK